MPEIFRDTAEAAVRSAFSNARKVRWGNGRVAEALCRRSADRILEEGRTHYMNPCLDHALAVAKILSESSGADCRLVATAGLRGTAPVGHFHVEARAGEGTAWAVETLRGNDVRIVPADLRPKDAWESARWSFRLAGGAFYEKPEDIFSECPEMRDPFLGIYLPRTLERLLRDNTEEKWKKFQAGLGRDVTEPNFVGPR